MIDSGTSFTHFPNDLYNEILGRLRNNKNLRRLFDSQNNCIKKNQIKLNNLPKIEIKF